MLRLELIHIAAWSPCTCAVCPAMKSIMQLQDWRAANLERLCGDREYASLLAVLEDWRGQVSVQYAPGRSVDLSAPLHTDDAIRQDGETRLACCHHGLGVGRRVVRPVRVRYGRVEEEEGRNSQQKQQWRHLPEVV